MPGAEKLKPGCSPRGAFLLALGCIFAVSCILAVWLASATFSAILRARHRRGGGLCHNYNFLRVLRHALDDAVDIDMIDSKSQEARELLAPVYRWFTEGFETHDLKESKAC
jgi:hypothetical protein